ncbi:hypothetical protein PHLCEN_2v11811 [Hermanssonia centrifuga]|uniref:Uncharacterized protein n=1 Tax=Hermanssonia centrifuga TaxID=98765 RepID=A0A2R6NIV5_9APHY|nr:hypothetical protein PHLCEN_2v11811 [Hermanssonia centrifuga]
MEVSLERSPSFGTIPFDLSISKLELRPHMGSYNLIFHYLVQARTTRGIECLDITVSREDDSTWDDIKCLALNNSATIQHIALDSMLTVHYDYEFFLTGYNLMSNYLKAILPDLLSLQSFTLTVSIPSKDGAIASASWFLLSTALFALPRSVRHVKLVLQPRQALEELPFLNRAHDVRQCIRVWGRSGFDWEQLRMAFNRLSGLETATFVSDSNTFWVDKVQDTKRIKTELPELERRGIIQYEAKDPISFRYARGR